MNATKALRKSIGRTVSLGMKMSRQRKELLEKAGFNFILTA